MPYGPRLKGLKVQTAHWSMILGDFQSPAFPRSIQMQSLNLVNSFRGCHCSSISKAMDLLLSLQS